MSCNIPFELHHPFELHRPLGRLKHCSIMYQENLKKQVIINGLKSVFFLFIIPGLKAGAINL